MLTVSWNDPEVSQARVRSFQRSFTRLQLHLLRYYLLARRIPATLQMMQGQTAD